MILRRRQRQNVLAVSHHYETGFLSGEELLNNHNAPRLTELAAKHGFGRRNRSIRCLCDHNTFAGGKSARLDDDWSSLPTDVLAVKRFLRERCVAGGWNPVTTQNLFSKGFEAFQLRGRPARAEASQT